MNVAVSTRLIRVGILENETILNNSSKTEIYTSITSLRATGPDRSQIYEREKTRGIAIDNLENRLSPNRQSCTSKYKENMKY
jgi:hypothetical protein